MENETLTEEEQKKKLAYLDFELSVAKKNKELKMVNSDLDFQLSEAKKNKELKTVKLDDSETRDVYEKFRKEKNCALCWKKVGCYVCQLALIGIFIGFCCHVVRSCVRVPDKWDAVLMFIVLALAAMIILGTVVFRCISAMSLNLKADIDANRKLNEKIDEKVMAKMG